MSKKNKKAEELVDTDADTLQATTEETAASDTTTEAPELSPEEQMAQDNEELQIQVKELKDKYLRVFAEFENFRKRSNRQRLELMKTAAEDTISSLLPVLDDFDRAKKSADAPDSGEQFSEGVELVYQKLYRILKAQGLTAMESNEQPFDPEFHEAITEIPAPTEELKGKVIDTVETGYLLKDKIIRHAKVVVGK